MLPPLSKQMQHFDSSKENFDFPQASKTTNQTNQPSIHTTLQKDCINQLQPTNNNVANDDDNHDDESSSQISELKTPNASNAN